MFTTTSLVCPVRALRNTVFFTAYFFVALDAAAQAVTGVTGLDTLMLDNSRGIHHESNTYAKNLLRQGATYAAIESGANIHVSRRVFSSTEDTGAQNFQEYFERVLEQYNVTWKLSSEEFIAISKKKFVCRVRGVVTSEKPENIDFGSMSTRPEFKEAIIISSKRYNKVTVNSSYSEGTKLGVYKIVKHKTVTGSATKEVVTGLAVVDYQGDNSSEAKIVRGLFHVHKKNEVKPLSFNTNRSGFGYEYNADALSASSDVSTYGKNFSSHTLFLYVQSYITKFGGVLGYEIIQCYQYRPGQIQYLNTAYLGVDYSIGLIPGFLYLRPGFNVGYVFDNDILEDPYWGQPSGRWDANVVLNPRLMGVLRFKKLELYGGVSYKYANDIPTLTNSFTTLGVRINLAKY